MLCGYTIKNDLSFRDYDIKPKMKFKIPLSKSFRSCKDWGTRPTSGKTYIKFKKGNYVKKKNNKGIFNQEYIIKIACIWKICFRANILYTFVQPLK